jgi:cyclohexadieny/prephenate dehydrogenase
LKPTVAIIGVGLIGGSLGAALRRSKRYRVLGIARRPSTLREAKRLGAIDAGSTNLTDVYQADIVVIATPVDSIVPIIRQIRPFLKSSAIVTDVGSVKGPLHQEVFGVRFVGAHPLAGSHKTGVKAARADLFRGAACVLVPLDRSAAGVVRGMWKTTGARVLEMPASAHDVAVALTSHLPHLIAHALVQAVMKRPNQKGLQALMAGSFRDVTRVASADPEQWVQIFQANLKNVHNAVRLFQRELNRLNAELSKPTLRTALKKSQAYRALLFNVS